MVVLNRVLNEVERVQVLVLRNGLYVCRINRYGTNIRRECNARLSERRFQPVRRVQNGLRIRRSPGEQPRTRQRVCSSEVNRRLIGVVVTIAKEALYAPVADEIAQAVAQLGVFVKTPSCATA